MSFERMREKDSRELESVKTINKMEKAKRKVDELIKKAKKERDEKGYRENLGYDLYGELEDYLKFTDLHYRERAKISEYFHLECDKI